ncbi:hypothetical protein E3Q18_02722 [Wallemia mellicola]|uniref:Uncharacterized protein n=2 Tax=Wallemia mellicola TaxID=1708541 RepID=A0A4T0NJE3_9BASI|nr:hypothetical protein E3Q18_02722 [Wallemia mellicola]TIC29473.1 hypothetical protein E3Q10_02584 [Wallemia mellicola]
MNNSFNHSLRPLAIFVSFVGLIYCVVRGASLLKDSTDSASELRTADIALGAIYLGLSVFELFGIIVAVKKSPRTVALYAKSIIGAGFIISSLEIAALIVHIKLKSESIDHCKNRLSDEDDQTRVDDFCNDDWSRGVWVHAIWMAVIIVLAIIFIGLWWRYKNQLQNNAYHVPKENEPQQPQAYPLQANLRYAPTLSYAPSRNQPDYVPPYPTDAAPPYDAKDYREDKEFQDVPFHNDANNYQDIQFILPYKADISFNSMSFNRNTVMADAGSYIAGIQYGSFAIAEVKHVFCRLRYKKHYADQIVADSDKLILGRFVRLLIVAFVVIFKTFRAFFLNHQDDIAINLTIYDLLSAGIVAGLIFSLDIAYLQELSESSTDPVQNDLESKAGLNAIEKIVEKPLNVQTPLNIAKSKPQVEARVNTLVSQPISSANSILLSCFLHLLTFLPSVETPYGYSLFTEFTPGSYLGFGVNIVYKKINAVCIVEKPNELIFGRAIYMIALALAVIFKASKAFFVDLQAALAVNYIIYHLLLTGTIAIFTYLLDITYLQEHSEDFHDLVQNDLESRAGLEAIKQIVWKFSGIQTAPNGTNNKPPGEDSANNLDPEPTSQAK